MILIELSHPTVSVDPEPLWTAINETLNNLKLNQVPYKCGHCVKVILYNEDAKLYANQSLFGVNFTAININSNAPDGFISQDFVDYVRNETMKQRDLTKSQPCIIVISLVNTKKEAKDEESETKAEDLDAKKWNWSLQLAKMLQFRMPLRSRYLLLVRFASSPDEFGHCRKNNQPYLKYPRRLVPIWEQVLFDYFSEAKVLLAVDGMKTVPTKKEEADFIWLCEEIMNLLDKEDQCKANMTEACKEQMANGKFSTVDLPMANCTKHTPRM